MVKKTGFAYALIGVGVIMVFVGIIDAVGGDDEEPTVAVVTSASGAPTTNAPAAVPSTTGSPSTVATTTSTTVTTTSTTTTSTTTTTMVAETVEDFVLAYAAAIASGDVDFLLDRLHPAVVGGFGPALCRIWIETEILELVDYQVTGPVVGPGPKSFTTPAGTGTIEDAFTAPISFVFQGQRFDAGGDFARVDGEIRWLGQCR